MPGATGFPPSDRSSAPDLVQTFSALQSLLLTAQGIDEFLSEVAKLAADLITRVSGQPPGPGHNFRRQQQPTAY